MRNRTRCWLLLCLIGTLLLLPGCGQRQVLQDGYYTAQASEFSHGWKEYVTILVKGGDIISVEYNAENPSYFVKSWDNAYMQSMLGQKGTYPNAYTRYYAAQLLENHGEGGFDAVTGATSSYNSFQLLAAAVIEQAKQGNTQIVLVDIPS